MTRKDYELIARTLREVRNELLTEPPQSGAAVVAVVARALGADLLNTNPRFDLSRFLRTCGIVEVV